MQCKKTASKCVFSSLSFDDDVCDAFRSVFMYVSHEFAVCVPYMVMQHAATEPHAMNAIENYSRSTWHTNAIVILFLGNLNWPPSHSHTFKMHRPYRFYGCSVNFFISFIFFFYGILFRLCMSITPPMNGACQRVRVCVFISINIVIYHLLNGFKR